MEHDPWYSEAGGASGQTSEFSWPAKCSGSTHISVLMESSSSVQTCGLGCSGDTPKGISVATHYFSLDVTLDITHVAHSVSLLVTKVSKKSVLLLCYTVSVSLKFL